MFRFSLPNGDGSSSGRRRGQAQAIDTDITSGSYQDLHVQLLECVVMFYPQKWTDYSCKKSSETNKVLERPTFKFMRPSCFSHANPFLFSQASMGTFRVSRHSAASMAVATTVFGGGWRWSEGKPRLRAQAGGWRAKLDGVGPCGTGIWRGEGFYFYSLHSEGVWCLAE